MNRTEKDYVDLIELIIDDNIHIYYDYYSGSFPYVDNTREVAEKIYEALWGHLKDDE